MTPQLILIETKCDFEKLHEYIKNREFIAFDTETTGLTKQDEIIGFSICAEENKSFYVITNKWDVINQKLEKTEIEFQAIQGFLHTLKTKSLIAHNSIFDCKMIESNYKISLISSIHTDTMILAHLLDENRKVGLKDLAKEYFGETSVVEQREMKESIAKNGGSLTKQNFEMFKADSYCLGKYGAKDALLTYKLFHLLGPKLFEENLDKFFYEEESMPLLKTATYQLNTEGCLIDHKNLNQLKKTLQAECSELKSFIFSEITPYIKKEYPGTNKKNTFNLGSSKQLSWLIFGVLNLEFTKLTLNGKNVAENLGLKIFKRHEKQNFIDTCLYRKDEVYIQEVKIGDKIIKEKKIKNPWSYTACDKQVLQKHAPKYKWIEKLLEYQKKLKILNTYIKGIEIRTKYGIINSSFLQHGTTSGRYASRNPNFQNLPREDKRIKECIIARPGKIFVGADYSQLEPRVFAYVSQDKKLMNAFNGTDDFYSVIGMDVYEKYDCVPKKDGSPDAFGIKYKNLRDLSKTIALAATYGATAYRLAPVTGKSIEDTQQDIDNYFERFPKVKEMMEESHKTVQMKGFVTSVFGRPRRLPEAKKIKKLYDPDNLPYEAKNILNLSVNHRIQSTAASIVNRAMIAFVKACNNQQLQANVVVQVHDSLIIECKSENAEKIASILQFCMEETTLLPGVKLEALPKIGNNLSKV